MSTHFAQRRRTQAFLYRIRNSTNVVLQYDFENDSLSVWKWPIVANGARLERVPPSDLWDHRISHNFTAPCCLCPYVKGEYSFKEAAICVPGSGRYNGEYVAWCALRECGYFVPLERIYSERGVPVKRYRSRNPDETPPHDPIVLHMTEGASAMETAARIRPRALRRSYAQLDVRDALPVQPIPRRGARGSALIKLLQLDSPVRPGLTETDFWALFVRCACGLVMTRRASRAHYCVGQEIEVIDLTLSDAETEVVDLSAVDEFE